MSIRDRRLIDGLMDKTKTGKQAALDAGYTNPSTVTSIVGRRMRSPSFREALQERLVEAGLDDTGLARKLREGSEAMAYGLTKDGNVVTMGPDAHARAKFVDMMLKVTGSYPDPRALVDMSGARVVVLQPSDASIGALGLFGAEVVTGAETPRLLGGASDAGERV